MKNEIWMPVKGFENYQVSNRGRVKNTDTNRLIKSEITQYRYERVRLIKDHKRYNLKVHRLVAIAFIPNPNNYPQVNHKNEIKTDNRVENLEWCNQLYNARYGTGRERNRGPRFIRVSQYDKNTKKLIKTYNSIRQAHLATGANEMSIKLACTGGAKTAGGFKWRFAPLEE